MSEKLETIRQCINEGDLAGSKRRLVNLLREDPDNIDAWVLLATLFDDPSRQIDCYRQILRIDPDHRHAAEKLKILSKPHPESTRRKKEDHAILCPQCGGVMEVLFIGELQDKRAVCPYCDTRVDLPDSFRRVRRTRETKQGLVGRRIVETTTVETRLDGQISPEDPESLPPEIRDIVRVLKEQGAEALDREHLQKLKSSGMSLAFSSAGFDAETIETLSELGFDIYNGPPMNLPSKHRIIWTTYEDTREKKPQTLFPDEIIKMAGGALPEEQRRKCPNPKCRAVISKEEKTCPWCGKSLPGEEE